jgi:fibronectin type 3 domain-containing protein
MWRAWVAVAGALFSAGCGSIGQPLPPALRLPQRVLDLSASQQGDKILVRFTVPARTTENLIIQKPVTADLGIGPAGTPSDLSTWDASAKHFTDIPTEKPEVRYAVPAGVWIGKDIVIAVRILSDKDRTAGWSNQVTLSVVAPLAPPTSLIQQEVSEGIRLTWQGDAPMYRVFRRVDAGENATALAETDRPTYLDTTIEYQKTYHYSVEAFRATGDVHASSEPTPAVNVTPIDKWPPPVPTGLAAIASPGRVELAWDRSTAPDLAGYSIYRADGDGSLTKIGETREGPSYSDRTVSAGKTYRYAVSAFDQIPNESEKSPPVSIQAH